MVVLSRTIRLHLLVLEQPLPLQIRNHKFHAKVYDLSCNSEVDNLLAESVGVDSETCFRCLHLLLVVRERLYSHAEDVEMGDNEGSERNVDECSQEDGEVRRDEVQDENLLGESNFVGAVCFVVFVFGELGREVRKDAQENRHEGCCDTGREEHLGDVSKVYGGGSNTSTHQSAFERTVIDLRNEDLDPKASRNQSSQQRCCSKNKRDLPELSLKSLDSWEYRNSLASNRVSDLLLVFEVLPLGFNL